MSICDLLIDLNHLNPFLDLPSRPFLQPRGSSMSSKLFYSCGNNRAKNNKGQNNSTLIGKVFKCVTLCNQVQVGPTFHSMLSHVNDWPRGRVISVNLFRQRISFKNISHFVFVFVWDNFLFFKCRSWHPAAQGITSGNGEPASPLTRLLHNNLNLRSSTFFLSKQCFLSCLSD